MNNAPDSNKAKQIATTVFDEEVDTCVRFNTGRRHWVYDVVLQSGRNVVIRLSDPDNRAELAGGLFWAQHLERVGVPIAVVLAHDIAGPQPFVALERLAGTDLGNCFDELGDAQLLRICAAVADLQRRTRRLPQAEGFGYALNYRSTLRPTWRSVLDASIDRSDGWIRAAGVVDPTWVKRVRKKLDNTASQLSDVTPTAFLHDATTKNVIISNGAVSGIVDIDEMAFGDPLWATALTKVSLLSAKRSTVYADEQAKLLSSSGQDRLSVYTALHCLGFLAELGQLFNQTKPAPVDPQHQAHLEAVLRSLL